MFYLEVWTSTSPFFLLLTHSTSPPGTFFLNLIRINTKKFLCSESQVGFPYSPLQNYVAHGIVNIKHCCFHEELKLGLSFLELKRKVNYCMQLQNRRHKKELLDVLNKFLFCPPENTYSEKYFPTELDSQALLFWKNWKLRSWGESEENGGQVGHSEEAAKNLTGEQKFLRGFSKERFCLFKAIFINGMF